MHARHKTACDLPNAVTSTAQSLILFGACTNSQCRHIHAMKTTKPALEVLTLKAREHIAATLPNPFCAETAVLFLLDACGRVHELSRHKDVYDGLKEISVVQLQDEHIALGVFTTTLYLQGVSTQYASRRLREQSPVAESLRCLQRWCESWRRGACAPRGTRGCSRSHPESGWPPR